MFLISPQKVWLYRVDKGVSNRPVNKNEIKESNQPTARKSNEIGFRIPLTDLAMASHPESRVVSRNPEQIEAIAELSPVWASGLWLHAGPGPLEASPELEVHGPNSSLSGGRG